MVRCNDSMVQCNVTMMGGNVAGGPWKGRKIMYDDEDAEDDVM